MTPIAEYVGCPECGAPAEIVDRFVLDSTDGPFEHLKLRCVTGRRFTVPTGGRRVPPAAIRREAQRWTAR